MISVKTKAIVWDLDGTLIDSFDFFYKLVAEILERRGLEMPSREAVAHNYHGKLVDTLQNILPESDELIIKEIFDEFLVLQDPLNEKVEQYLYKDAISLATEAHAIGKRQVLVSNRVHKNNGNGSPKSIISKPPLRGIIDIAICADDNEFHKPDPRVLEKAIREFGLTPQDFTIIGDQFVDAVLAKNLGTKAILVNRNDHDIPHLEQLGEGWKNFVTIIHSLDEVEIHLDSL